jgi:cell division protein FtsB
MKVQLKNSPLTPRRLLKPMLWLSLAFYIGYHTLHGERGLYALMRDQREVAHLSEELAKTKAEREKMELRVTHLRDGSLDRDLLDEQMRRMMGMMKKGEVVVLDAPAKRS